MPLTGTDLVTLGDLTTDEMQALLDLAAHMAEAIGFDDRTRRTASRPLDRILATLFFEPSTRTRLSFESAMLRLGGQVIGFADPSSSSVRKGETLADTIRMVSGYADIIAIRHPLAGAARVAADYATVPVINAGDGPHEHPTQTLTDLFCIARRKGSLSGLTVGLCGDLKYGRTVHSLAPTMARFGSEIVCISPPELAMPGETMDEVARLSGRRPRECAALGEALPALDVLYMTRVQRERFERPEDYERVQGCCVLTPELMAQAPAEMIVLHPLPRVDEITPEVDADPRACYFEQAAGGVPIRMALIASLLGTDGEPRVKGSFRLDGAIPHAATAADAAAVSAPAVAECVTTTGARCTNARCITTTEAYLAPRCYESSAGLRCAYCDHIAN